MAPLVLVLSLLADIPPGLLHVPSQYPVTINICCLRNTSGSVRVSLYRSDTEWQKGKPMHVAVLPIKGPKMQVVLPSQPAGRYAVGVLHDENANSKMDMRWFPYPAPAEGVGVTNNAEGKLGPPSFQDASFLIADKPLTFDINLRYY